MTQAIERKIISLRHTRPDHSVGHYTALSTFSLRMFTMSIGFNSCCPSDIVVVLVAILKKSYYSGCNFLPVCERRWVMFFERIYVCILLWHAQEPKRFVVFYVSGVKRFVLVVNDTGYIKTKKIYTFDFLIIINYLFKILVTYCNKSPLYFTWC